MARGRLALIAAALSFYAVFIVRTSFIVRGERWFVLFEDAMISMRYGRNLAAGNGLVWNAGEPPVEGYTNLLWTLWMAATHELGLPESKISLAIMLTGVFILLANGLIVERLCAKITGSSWAPTVAMAAALFHYPLVFWTLRGMEVGALTLVVDTLLLLAISLEEAWSTRQALGMGLLAGTAILLRSDAAVPVGLISLYAFATIKGRSKFVLAGLVGVGALTAMAGQLTFRRAYYHEVLPNTYYLKLLYIPFSARLKRGLFVALQVLAFHLAVPLAFAVGALATRHREARWWKVSAHRRLALLGTVFAAQASYAVYVGGDAWEWMLYANRYVCVGMPAFAILVAALMARLLDSVKDDEQKRARAVRAFAITVAASGVCLGLLNLFAARFPEHGVARTIAVSKSTAAAAALFVGAGVVFLLPQAARVLSRALINAARALAGPDAFRAALGLALAIWLPANAYSLANWAARNAAQFQDEARYSRLGLLIAASTPKTARIAVVAAGATPYFSQRPAEDLLGKNDAVIAKRRPTGVFSPGHDKWDYTYSLGDRHPDLVVELADVTPEDERYAASLGFRALPNGLLLREDAIGVDRRTLGMPFETTQEISDALSAAGAR